VIIAGFSMLFYSNGMRTSDDMARLSQLVIDNEQVLNLVIHRKVG
jgi:hypothetical protein